MIEAVRLEGRLVVLEPLRSEHGEGLRQAAAHPEIWRWTQYDGASEDGFRAWLEHALRAAEEGSELPWATLDAATGGPIGSTRFLSLRPEHRGLEIGYTWLTPAAWGTGANREAKLLQLEHAFERLGCVRVEFKTDARNEPSRRALEALPARFEGVFRKHMLVRGGLRDSAYYSITDDEWPEVKTSLLRRLSRPSGDNPRPGAARAE